MSYGTYSGSVLSAMKFDTNSSTPFSLYILPIHSFVNRHCKCSPQKFKCFPPEGNGIYLNSINETKNVPLFISDPIKSKKLSGTISEGFAEHNQIKRNDKRDQKEKVKEEEEGEEEEEEEEEEKRRKGKPERKISLMDDINSRRLSKRVDQQELESCLKEGSNTSAPTEETRKDDNLSPRKHSRLSCWTTSHPDPPPPSSGENTVGTLQDYRRLSSTGSERLRNRRPVTTLGHSTPTEGKRHKTRNLEMIVLTLTLLFITPVSGGYDKGGPQHQITWGRGNSPPGSAVFGNAPSNVTAVVGHRARLPCQVKNLGLKDVSWIRQRDLHILTVGIFTYTSDDRFKVFHPHETEDWFLDISSVTFRDSGVYECQVSTSPKVSLPINLTVLGVQEADIPGPNEVFIQHGSTISLQCEVQAGVESVGPVHWLKGAATLNYSSPRGGISMEVEKTPTKTMSKLYITRAVRNDSGNYTCAPLFAKPDSVLVHVVVDGEESAAAVHSGSNNNHHNHFWSNNGISIILLLWIATMLPFANLFPNRMMSSTRP